MAVFDLYSKRRKRERGECPDVFSYDEVPHALRVQIVHIWQDGLGNYSRNYSRAHEAWQRIHDVLAREFGVFKLGSPLEEPNVAVANYFLKEDDNERVLDIIELSFQSIIAFGNNWDYVNASLPSAEPEEAIAELNRRFLEHAVGYTFESGHLIRKDSECTHKEVVLPALKVLQERRFQAANDEYLRAHVHYRNGRYEECLTDCLKAFESTMKVICKGRKWSFKETDTAKTLIDICFQSGLIPAYFQSEFGALRTCLESGLPTVRNKMGAHGAGTDPRRVNAFYASYALNLTAANIVFLAEADKSLG